MIGFAGIFLIIGGVFASVKIILPQLLGYEYTFSKEEMYTNFCEDKGYEFFESIPSRNGEKVEIICITSDNEKKSFFEEK